MWYNRVVQDIGNIPDFIAYYEAEWATARTECHIRGSVEKSISQLPGITEHRFNQLQEIEAVLNYLNIQLRKIRRKWFQKYIENYNRALSSRDAEKYVDGDEEVIDMEMLVNELAYLRNRYLGVMKALETKNYMLGHISKLRVAGLDDAAV